MLRQARPGQQGAAVDGRARPQGDVRGHVALAGMHARVFTACEPVRYLRSRAAPLGIPFTILTLRYQTPLQDMNPKGFPDSE